MEWVDHVKLMELDYGSYENTKQYLRQIQFKPTKNTQINLVNTGPKNAQFQKLLPQKDTQNNFNPLKQLHSSNLKHSEHAAAKNINTVFKGEKHRKRREIRTKDEA